MSNRYLTLKEAADYTGLNLTYIYRWSSGQLSAPLPGKLKLGSRTVRIDKVILDEWLKNKTSGDLCE